MSLLIGEAPVAVYEGPEGVGLYVNCGNGVFYHLLEDDNAPSAIALRASLADANLTVQSYAEYEQAIAPPERPSPLEAVNQALEAEGFALVLTDETDVTAANAFLRRHRQNVLADGFVTKYNLA